MDSKTYRIKTHVLLTCLVSGLRVTRFTYDSSAALLYKDQEGGLQPAETSVSFALPSLAGTAFESFLDDELFGCGLTALPDINEVYEVCQRLNRIFNLSSISIFRPHRTGYVLKIPSALFGSGWCLPRVGSDGRWEGLLVYRDLWSEPDLIRPFFRLPCGKSGISGIRC